MDGGALIRVPLTRTPAEGTARSSGAAPAVIVMIAALVVLAGCERDGTAGSRSVDGDSAALPIDSAALPVDSVPAAPAPTSADELRAALEARMRGPSTGAEAGADASMFTAETADALRSVTVDPAGHATVDFHDLRPIIPNASSSAGSTVLLEELNATVFRFPDIRSVEYRMEGSCDLFWEWLQYECQTITRESGIP